MTDELHDIICEAMKDAGLEPVTFEKPLKSIYALVKLTKAITPNSLAERSQAVGWCIGTLMDNFGKKLHNVKSLIVCNEPDKVTAEALVHVCLLTFEDDHIAFLDGYIAKMAGEDYPSHGYCWRRLSWRWDTAERISDVMGFTQVAGGGKPTGELMNDANDLEV